MYTLRVIANELLKRKGTSGKSMRRKIIPKRVHRKIRDRKLFGDIFFLLLHNTLCMILLNMYDQTFHAKQCGKKQTSINYAASVKIVDTFYAYRAFTAKSNDGSR